MLGIKKKPHTFQHDIDSLYVNKEMILNHLPKVKNDKSKKKLLTWIERINKIIQTEFDKAS